MKHLDGAHDVICIGASTGGVLTLARLLGDLPVGLDAAVVALLATSPRAGVGSQTNLQPVSAMRVVDARDGTSLVRGEVYVAPTGSRLRVSRGGTLSMSRCTNPKGNVVDELFRSAAEAFGPHLVGVVLSGDIPDGAAGLDAIRGRGGATIVQSPAEASALAMPLAAIANADPDFVLRLRQIAGTLTRLCGLAERGDAPRGTPL
jgi:two-component system, chemotaxis family, protein-glutamate methylesterase/glutaminase